MSLRQVILIKTMVLVVFVAGCSGNPSRSRPIPPPPTISWSNLNYSMKAGTASVYGQAFAQTRGGRVIYGAGRPVILILVDPFTGWCLNYQVGDNEACREVFSKYARVVRADAEGRFEFVNLPLGVYRVISDVKWRIPWGSTYAGEEVVVRGTVFVRDGERKKVDLMW